MKIRGDPLLLEFPIREGNGKPIIAPDFGRAQQTSRLKSSLPGNSWVEYFAIGCFKVILQSGLDHKINM
jgi:hypothetical protein